MSHNILVVPDSPEIGENGLKIIHHILIHLLISNQDVTYPELHRRVP